MAAPQEAPSARAVAIWAISAGDRE